jgi:hypothetical protein
MAESRILTDDDKLTAEEFAQFMADDADEPTPEEMALSDKIAARYEEQQELPD